MKKIYEKIKPFCVFVLKVLFWLILLGAILFFTNYSDEKIPLFIVLCAYIFILLNFYNSKDRYNDWQNSEAEFYKRFCKSWHPTIVGYLFVFVFGIIYFDLFQFLLFMFLTYCTELWDRRFITADIKQDLILEELKKR